MQAADPIEKYKKAFYQECEELLTELDSLLPLLAADGTSGSEALNGAFRVLHTVKGGAGMFRLNRIAGLAHEFEGALEIMRSKQQAITQSNILQFFRTSDVLQDLLQAERSGEGLPDAIDADAAEQLHLMVGTQSSEKTSPPPILVEDIDPKTTELSGILTTYRITFRPNLKMLRNGNEPLLIFRQLEEYGQVSIVADISRLPTFEEVDPTSAYLAWTIELKTDAGFEAIRQTFEFVEGDCELEISIAASDSSEAVPAANPGSNSALANQPSSTHEASAPANSAIRESRRASSIRVELERIDKLVNMVGEIAIVQAMIAQQTGQEFAAAHPRLVQDIGQLFQLTQSLQDSVMSIRALPIGSIFGRIPRLVRELSAEIGKKV
ncbi:MAG: Hpt domain-containing protein, partial [Aestuariivirga sp.]